MSTSLGAPFDPPAPPAPPGGHDLLAGRVVLVTAAAGTGIGSATARRCLEEGASVVVSDAHERRLGETAEEAHAKHQRLVNSPAFIEMTLTSISTITDIDFSKFDLDKPLPRLTTNGEQCSLDKFAQWGSGKTLRQLAMERFGAPGTEVDFVGSPDTVAERMANAMEAIGGDGFLISTPFQRVGRRSINEVCEGLVPALQRRGLVREAYTQPTLRQTLRGVRCTRPSGAWAPFAIFSLSCCAPRREK